MKNQLLLKLLTFVFVFGLSVQSSFAQMEIKVSPLGLLFGSFKFQYEYGISENMGIELTPRIRFGTQKIAGVKYSQSGFGLGANYRYYFNPSKSIDKFYGGVYCNYSGGTLKVDTDKITNTDLAVGFLFGYKVVSSNEKLIFDFNVGGGRALIRKFDDGTGTSSVNIADIPFFNWDIVSALSVGYRFNSGKK